MTHGFLLGDQKKSERFNFTHTSRLIDRTTWIIVVSSTLTRRMRLGDFSRGCFNDCPYPRLSHAFSTQVALNLPRLPMFRRPSSYTMYRGDDLTGTTLGTLSTGTVAQLQLSVSVIQSGQSPTALLIACHVSSVCPAAVGLGRLIARIHLTHVTMKQLQKCHRPQTPRGVLSPVLGRFRRVERSGPKGPSWRLTMRYDGRYIAGTIHPTNQQTQMC